MMHYMLLDFFCSPSPPIQLKNKICFISLEWNTVHFISLERNSLNSSKERPSLSPPGIYLKFLKIQISYRLPLCYPHTRPYLCVVGGGSHKNLEACKITYCQAISFIFHSPWPPCFMPLLFSGTNTGRPSWKWKIKEITFFQWIVIPYVTLPPRFKGLLWSSTKYIKKFWRIWTCTSGVRNFPSSTNILVKYENCKVLILL